MSSLYSYSEAGTGSSRRSRRTPGTTLSAKDPAFEQALIDRGKYPPEYEYPDDYDAPIPGNVERVTEGLGRPRPSLSPSQFGPEEFRNLKKANGRATSEPGVVTNVFPIIRGIETMPYGQEHHFNHLEPLAPNISDPKPDYYNGSRPTQINTDVRNNLGAYIVPCNQKHRPTLPNFFMEAKGPDGKASEAKRQITQDLAAGARGMHAMQSYGLEEPVYDGNAYAFGSTYHSGTGTLKLYAMHPTEPAEPDREPEYHTTQIGGYDLTHNSDTCRQGIGAWRNLRDVSKEYRDEFITRANEVTVDKGEPETAGSDAYLTSFTSVSQSTQNELFASDTIHEESETSMDELALPTPPSKRTRRHQPSRKRRKSKISQIVIDEDDE
jgi:hypothetical protein